MRHHLFALALTAGFLLTPLRARAACDDLSGAERLDCLKAEVAAMEAAAGGPAPIQSLGRSNYATEGEVIDWSQAKVLLTENPSSAALVRRSQTQRISAAVLGTGGVAAVAGGVVLRNQGYGGGSVIQGTLTMIAGGTLLGGAALLSSRSRKIREEAIAVYNVELAFTSQAPTLNIAARF